MHIHRSAQAANGSSRHEQAVLGVVRGALNTRLAQGKELSEAPPLRITANSLNLSRAELRGLANCLADQHGFAQHALKAIRRLLNSLATDNESAVPAGGAAGEDDAGPEASGSRTGTTSGDDAGEASADDLNEAGESEEDADDAASEPVLHDDPAGETQTTVALTDAADGEHRAADEAAWVVSDQGSPETSAADTYRVFTTRHDRTVAAPSLAQPVELAALRRRLDTYINLQGQLVQRLANRLYRRLLARQRRAWQFDEPEGELDPARLSRLITDPMQPLVFRREQDGPFRDTAVTLLLDNSRSMLGRPILVAAACADILARTLERCGVAVEVLGFTTASLHGGKSARQWEHQGRPDSPGRISDLRHIVYKAASQPWRRARGGFGLMLKPDLLNQNVDGEALQWAHKRLMQRPASRRLLLVISDGAPVDVNTLAANDEQYLAAHLHQVIAGIEARDDVELMAIGIGHDVSSWYRRAVRIADARELGNVLISELTELFDE